MELTKKQQHIKTAGDHLCIAMAKRSKLHDAQPGEVGEIIKNILVNEQLADFHLNKADETD